MSWGRAQPPPPPTRRAAASSRSALLPRSRYPNLGRCPNPNRPDLVMSAASRHFHSGSTLSEPTMHRYFRPKSPTPFFPRSEVMKETLADGWEGVKAKANGRGGSSLAPPLPAQTQSALRAALHMRSCRSIGNQKWRLYSFPIDRRWKPQRVKRNKSSFHT